MRETATLTGTSERTIFRRLETAKFTARVRELRSEMVQNAAGKLASLMTKASEALEGLLGSESEDIQHKAAKTILEQAVKVADSAEMLNRIEALERNLFGTEDSE